MKKILFIVTLITTLGIINAGAQQGGGDPAAMLARMKERVKPLLIEKAKLTDIQADKVIEINFESRH